MGTDMWTLDELKKNVCNWEALAGSQSEKFLDVMNARFPPEVFWDHLDRRRRAIANAAAQKKLLDGAVQAFPQTADCRSLEASFEDMAGCAVVFTAGGEGERLRLSLLDRGVPEDALRDFTKATYPLKGFYEDYGALQINLAMTGRICREFKIDIPVIVTTGPEPSVTARVIPEILRKRNNFGLSNVMTVPQDERLHFTVDEKIAVQLTDGNLGGGPYPVTHPDETGGPLMKLKRRLCGGGGCGVNTVSGVKNVDGINGVCGARASCVSAPVSPLERLAGLGCEKILIVQGTAVYEPKMLAYMAAAAKGRDCAGVGIPRADFPPSDPFGTFVTVEKDGRRMTCIVEQDIRNDGTRAVVNAGTNERLPFNTGLYAVDRRLLEANDLPDYATPPKEVLPGLPRSPKAGYAATDILPLAKSPVILTVKPDMYAVIKTADDLEALSDTAARFGLREMCAAGSF